MSPSVTAIISLNSINQLIFVLVKCCVLFELQPKLLIIIKNELCLTMMQLHFIRSKIKKNDGKYYKSIFHSHVTITLLIHVKLYCYSHAGEKGDRWYNSDAQLPLNS
jgi:hypothetical protein